ncbi:hypothetical protein ACOSQ4_004380 [Xanthoceras sorbifolium]
MKLSTKLLFCTAGILLRKIVLTINFVGLVMKLSYSAIFFIYDHQNKGRKKVVLGLLGEVVFCRRSGCHHLYLFSHLCQEVSRCDVFNIIMYASPLAIVSSLETVRGVAAVAMEFPISDEAAPSSFSTPVRVPTRIRKRLSAECKTPSTVEEIEAKLRHADLRRQVFNFTFFN